MYAKQQIQRLLPLLTVICLLSRVVGPAQAQDPLPDLQLDENGVPAGCEIIEGDIIICGDPNISATFPDRLCCLPEIRPGVSKYDRCDGAGGGYSADR